MTTLTDPKQRTKAVTTESRALTAGAIAFVVTALIGLVAFAGHDAPLAGPGSVGQLAALTGAACTLVVFVISYTLATRTPSMVWLRGSHLPKQILDVAALAFAHAALALLTILVSFWVIQRGFTDAVLYFVPAALFAAAIVAGTIYFVYLSAARMDMFRLSTLLAVFLVAGGLTSMLTAQDPHWWQENVSTLGIDDDFSSAAFNVTLVVTGIILTTLANYMTTELELTAVAAGRPTRGPRVVKWSLVLIGLFLACVGIFPTDEFHTIHNTVAIGMALIYVYLVIAVRSLIPSLPRTFLALGYLFIAVIGVAAVLYGIGYYNLTAVELIAAVLIFTWVIVLIRNTAAVSQDDRTEAHAQLDHAAGLGSESAVAVAPNFPG